MSTPSTLHLYQDRISLTELHHQLEELCDVLNFIWGSGEDKDGFWCELWSFDSTKLYRGETLQLVLRKAIVHLKKYLG